MFDFLFKRKPKTPPTPVVVVAPIVVAPTAAREAAMTAAKAVQHDEAASVAFLIACDFADARLLAAQTVHSVPALQQVLAATRKTDRRVAKLMQTRLDQLDTQRKLLALATTCIADADRLANATTLTPNQVSELDRRWQALTLVPESEQQAFATSRATLGIRLAAQATLQRAVLDTLAQLRALPAEQPPEVVRATLDALVASLADLRLSADIGAVPKHLLVQCDEAAQVLRTSLVAFEQRHAASLARLALLEEWEAAAPESLQESTLRRGWQGEVAPEWQQRFDELLQRVIAARPVKVAPVMSVLPVSDQKPIFIAALQAMEQALEEGSLQIASEADKRLRSLDLAALRPSEAETAQLSRLRAELGRLQGWARWGGNVSREELQKAAEALPEQALAMGELAKKIGSLRERWKSLDGSAGSAPKELWHGFDAACTAAYAPVAEHFARLAEERQANVGVATDMIADMQRNADALVGVEHPDWKAVALFCQRSLQSWQRLGPTERKEKKRLDAEFNAVLQRLRAPLDDIRASEIREREQMIADVVALSPNDRGALDALRVLQDRWQERAKALPLERNDEQGLWTRFRAACDTVFARRKEAVSEADAGRQDNLHAKEALCVALEQAGELAIPQVVSLLRDTANAWHLAGPVPRAAESAIDTRYRQAVTALQQQVDHAQRASDALAKQAILAKLQLCQQVESALVAGGDAAALQDQWQALPALATPFERALGQRFEQAQIAAQQTDTAYAATLEANRTVLGRELLRMEIVLSLDSPAELMRERLQLQVEVLQAALKSGQPVATEQQMLVALCNLPALTDGTATERLQRVLERVL